ncbi:sensor histidine kinase, partial [Rickettsiella grylli]|uniref:sensor histidine kinase n=1 Tax=Rickettsiella grylli TaxID=59196 RepID=UPI000B0964FA
QFYRAHPSYRGVYSGYGVGLYLVKKAVDLLDGKITVSSQEGKGSCFTLAFNFPLAKEDAKEIGKPMDFFGGTKVY